MKSSGCIFGVPMVVLALILIFFGVLWIMSSTAPEAGTQSGSRFGVGICLNVVGLLLIGGAGLLMYRTYKKHQAEKSQTIVHKVDFTGDLSLEELKCKACGATLSKDNIDVKAGAVVVSCPYCGTSYEIEEKPKW
jgi:hypothetical protein